MKDNSKYLEDILDGVEGWTEKCSKCGITIKPHPGQLGSDEYIMKKSGKTRIFLCVFCYIETK